jgi:hypothetical protein
MDIILKKINMKIIRKYHNSQIQKTYGTINKNINRIPNGLE